jgi:hypothetical protein
MHRPPSLGAPRHGRRVTRCASITSRSGPDLVCWLSPLARSALVRCGPGTLPRCLRVPARLGVVPCPVGFSHLPVCLPVSAACVTCQGAVVVMPDRDTVVYGSVGELSRYARFTVVGADTSHPGTDGGTFAVQPGTRMALCMPRQQDVIVGQWLGETAGDGDDIQRSGGNAITVFHPARDAKLFLARSRQHSAAGVKPPLSSAWTTELQTATVPPVRFSALLDRPGCCCPARPANLPAPLPTCSPASGIRLHRLPTVVQCSRPASAGGKGGNPHLRENLISLHTTLRCCYVWKKLGGSGVLWHRARQRGSAREGRRFLGAFHARW